MEEGTSSETPTFLLNRHRRTHLRSNTYYTLLRILSHCRHHSYCSHDDITADHGSSGLEQVAQNEVCNELVVSVEPEAMPIKKDPMLKVSSDNTPILKETVDESPEDISIQKDPILNESPEDMPIGEDLIVNGSPQNMSIQKDQIVKESPEDMAVQKDQIVDKSPEDMPIQKVGTVVESPENMPIRKDRIIDGSPEAMPIQEDLIVDESAKVTGYHGAGSSHVTMIMDELEQIMRGEKDKGAVVDKLDMNQDGTVGELEQLMEIKEDKEAVVGKNISLLPSSLDKNGNSSHVDSFDLQCVMEEDENGEQLKANGQNNFVDLEDLDLSIDDYINGEDSKAGVNNNEKSSHLKGVVLEEPGLQAQQKEMELDESVSLCKKINSPFHMTIDDDMEEGELSDDSMVDDQSVESLLEDDVASETKKVEESISENIVNKEEFTCNEQVANYKDSESTYKVVGSVDNADHGIDEEVTESNRGQMKSISVMDLGRKTTDAKKANGSDSMQEAGRCKPQGHRARVDFDSPTSFLDDLVFRGESLAENAAENLSLTFVKEGTGVSNKRKRVISKEQGTKRKKKNRKKRAEKNKELGVKRLRLPPVSKPKTITYCRHFLKGRCQEGDQCKFSHDTIPLTKSLPCCYFVRGTCMKGDDCPFDHQLSNYPCNNYVSKGFCSRGDDCLFSHKMPLKESSPTAVNFCKPALAPPSLPRESNSKKLKSTSHQNANSLSYPVGIFPQSNMGKNVAGIVLKPPGQAIQGMNLLSIGKSPIENSVELKQIGSSSKKDEGFKGSNQKTQDTTQNMNEKAKRTPPAVAPRGINFLSFGKAPLNDSSVKKLASSPLNREDGVKISPLGNSNEYERAGLSSTRNGGINISNQFNQSAKLTLQNLNEVSNRKQPTVAQGINFLSFAEAPLDDSSSKKPSELPFTSNNQTEIFIQKRQMASSGFQISSAVPWRIPASPLLSASDQVVHGQNKDTPNSTPKALLSTLAFAAKYESASKINRSTAAPSVSNEANKEIKNASNSGGSQNESMKASTILDFLFNSDSKTEQ